MAAPPLTRIHLRDGQVVADSDAEPVAMRRLAAD